LGLIFNETITREQAKRVISEIIGTSRMPDQVVEALGLHQLSDEPELDHVVELVIRENPNAVSDYQAGKRQAIAALLEAVRRQTGGSANMKLASELLRKRLS
jgi:aspartyl-tRNA(Asn)/glutamyl-tRNA(Gln) amidotransferase subunit B